MGLFSGFFARPHPLGRGVDVPDDRLAALGDVDVLESHFLLAAASIALKGFDLRREAARQGRVSRRNQATVTSRKRAIYVLFMGVSKANRVRRALLITLNGLKN